MGCGSSSTNVEPFRNPEENKNHRTQRAPSRKSSASLSHKSQQSAGKHDKKFKRKSSGSSTSSSGSRRQTKADVESRENSAATKNTYTIQRPNSDVLNTAILVAPHDENENIESNKETPVLTLENEFEDKGIDNKIDNEIEDKKIEAQKHHEAIQKQTFITGDPNDEIHDENQTVKTRAERHEEIAKQKEGKRLQYNYEILEANIITDNGLVALVIPEMEECDTNVNYTIDDIVAHNNELADLDWFKYGKTVYSWKKMLPIIQERVDQFKKIREDMFWYQTPTYPIHIAREHGVSRKELASVLEVCRVGTWVDLPREEYLARMKQSAENVLEEDTGSEYFKDYKNQLGRWLANYPMNKVNNDPPSAQSDPNETMFPLPPDIQADPSVLRKWIETWTEFDLVVPEEGAWQQQPLLKDDWGDTHELFAKSVQEQHDDGSMEPFDMSIDGDVAWIEIELDLFKNDKTTDLQESVWKKRAKRTNLNDPEWMKKRRDELGMALKKRYELMQKEYPVENFKSFAEILEQHWKEFQELCEKEFILPEGNHKRTKDPKLSKRDNQNDVHRDNDKAEIEDNRLVINHDQEPTDSVSNAGTSEIPTFETMDSGLELDSAEPQDQGSTEKEKRKTNEDDIQVSDRSVS